MKKIREAAFAFLLFFSLSALYTARQIPDRLSFGPGDEIKIESLPGVSLSKEKQSGAKEAAAPGDAISYTAKFLGFLPVKEVSVQRRQTRYVNVSGKPFGIKMFCDGVMVVGFSDILTASGYRNPAREAGLKEGDVIYSVNGSRVRTNEELARAVEKGGKAAVRFYRDGRDETVFVTAVTEQSSGVKKTGMWVRDSGAGIGTMTFYDENFDYFAGLGHGIKDADTHTELPLLSGETVPVRITGIVKSKNGEAGRLKGTFLSVSPAGKVLSNSATGVYGKCYVKEGENLMPVANPAAVREGEAYILTTINGTKPAKYSVKIEKLSLNADDRNKNMVIRVTDKRLLSLTGGIVRGMSGSPIIQDGALVGAVTHVFVNRVDRGYGIFARNMAESLDAVARKDRAA